jgi:hypothetical protein
MFNDVWREMGCCRTSRARQCSASSQSSYFANCYTERVCAYLPWQLAEPIDGQAGHRPQILQILILSANPGKALRVALRVSFGKERRKVLGSASSLAL